MKAHSILVGREFCLFKDGIVSRLVPDEMKVFVKVLKDLEAKVGFKKMGGI